MKLINQKMIFKIMADDVDFTKEFLLKFNKKNNTEFELVEVHYDEVIFMSIESNSSNNDDIIKLGIQYAKSALINRIEK